ncbi:MAG: hypothetical protein Q7S29_05545 [Candidatus Peribacter sp.]|nr:hypothetical protein [Candidatus Peribacter sp.]
MQRLDAEAEARRIVKDALRDHLYVERASLADETLQLAELGADSLDIPDILIEVEQDVQSLLDRRQCTVDHFIVEAEVTTATTIAALIAATTNAITSVIAQKEREADEVKKR